jgi:hypothetical protein
MLMTINTFKQALTIACLNGENLQKFARDYKNNSLLLVKINTKLAN